MKRPVGISILAVLFMAIAVCVAAAWISMFARDARFDRAWEQAEFLLSLTVCFFVGAVAVGLWNLEPGARRVVLVIVGMFAVPFSGVGIAEIARGATLLDHELFCWFVMVALVDSTAVYLNLPHVRRSFQQLDFVTLNLK
jgi:cytochrome bd-type quinol oxidase subunit 2